MMKTREENKERDEKDENKAIHKYIQDILVRG
jgi:hypothetical protein